VGGSVVASEIGTGCVVYEILLRVNPLSKYASAALDTLKLALRRTWVFSSPDCTERNGLFSKRHAVPEFTLPMKNGETIPVGSQFGNAGLEKRPNVDP
jgi:hypothetical protein